MSNRAPLLTCPLGRAEEAPGGSWSPHIGHRGPRRRQPLLAFSHCSPAANETAAGESHPQERAQQDAREGVLHLSEEAAPCFKLPMLGGEGVGAGATRSPGFPDRGARGEQHRQARITLGSPTACTYPSGRSLEAGPCEQRRVTRRRK